MKDQHRSVKRPQASNIKCVIFDLDGTLLDTVDLIHRSFDYAVRKVLGRDLSREELLANMGRPLIEQMRHFSAAHTESLLNAYNAHNLDLHDDNISVYPDTRETLDWLANEARISMAIVTSKKRDLSLRGISLMGLSEYFPVVIAMEDTVLHKPEPEPIELALKKLGQFPHQTIFVGDSPFDLQAGKAAGVFTAAALWGPFSRQELQLHDPDFELTSLLDLRDVLR